MFKLSRYITRGFKNPFVFTSRCMENDASLPTSEPIRPPLPLITSRNLQNIPKYAEPRQAWLCNMDSVEEEKLGLLDLHPSVFGAMPRFDVIFHNLNWQLKYHFIDHETEPTRAEMRGGGRKPWPQKGTGRARHGSIRSPIFFKGGKAHGKRGPKTYFFMLPMACRVFGLVSMLTVKYYQNDLVIVDSLDIPSKKPEFMEQLIESRKWGLSVLFVNDCDVMPVNISLATEKMEPIGLMPYYGLNVHSMLKFDTLVLTLEALNKIEERLLFCLSRADLHEYNHFDRRRFNQSVLMNST